MRQVIAAVRCGNRRAQLAFDISSTGCHSGIGSMLAAFDVAEQSSSLRARRGMQPLYVSGARRRYEQKHRCKCGSGRRRNRSESASARCTRPGRLSDRAGMLAAAFEYQPSILAATTLDSTLLHGCPVIPGTSGPNRDLDDTIPPLAKEFVRFRDLVERKCVRQEWPQIQTAVADELHESPHPFFSAWAQRRNNFVTTETCRERLERHG
jgi:hypothetical protein